MQAQDTDELFAFIDIDEYISYYFIFCFLILLELTAIITARSCHTQNVAVICY